MSVLLQNIRTGIRSLRRTPGFALTAILTLALGIGLSTAVFTVAEALLLRRLAVADQDRVVALWGEMRDGSFNNFPLGLADAREFARTARSVEQLAWFAYDGASPIAVRDGDGVSRMRRALVSGDFFQVLGVRPVMGRTLTPADDDRGAEPVVVLSHGAWQQRFGGEPSVLGRQIVMHNDGRSFTVVGIMPQGIDYPRGAEVWASVIRSTQPEHEQHLALHLIGRLAPDVPPEAAREELTAFFGRPEATAWQSGLRGVVHSLPVLILGDTRPALIVFMAASGLLLLITCINVANLLLVRGLARVREVAVRSALGAGRGRVIGQLLTENALLAVAGGALGFAFAVAAVRTFVSLAPSGLPRLEEIQIDATVMAAALGITAVAMLLFALAPAIMTSRVQLQQALRSGGRSGPSRGARMATEILVAAQVALALVVLSAAGLIGRSLMKLEGTELSFDASRLVVAELALRMDQYGNPVAQRAMLERLTPRLEAIPGVEAVSPVVAVPFSGTRGWDSRPGAEGQSPEEAAANPMLNMELVAPNYFATFRMPVLRGRAFTEEDRQGTTPVVMISESAARHYWPGEDAIGKRMTMGRSQERPFTVIGIVPDTRYRDLRDARPSIYFPLLQSFFPFVPTTLAIRASGRPTELVPAVRAAIEETAPGVALASAAPFEQFLDGPLAQPRLNAWLLAVFAGAAVVLAAVGLFGVMATMVRQRTRELGVRMALGATTGSVRWMVIRRGVTIAAVGAVGGLVGALLANRLLAAMLYEVSPTDLTTLAAVTLALLGIAFLASLIPARMGTQIDPVIALRADG